MDARSPRLDIRLGHTFDQLTSEFNASSNVVAQAELAFRQRSIAGSIKHRSP